MQPVAEEHEATARAVLVAAGQSTRMHGSHGVRKPLIELLGRPLLEHTLAPFALSACVRSIVVVAHPDDLERVRALVADSESGGKVVAVVAGGAERVDSVRIGCLTPPHRPEESFEVLCVHDAARPFVDVDAIDACVRTAAVEGAALVAVPVRDTLKRSRDGTHVEGTVDREGLFHAQTPQCFQRRAFVECLREADATGLAPTDDTTLWEHFHGAVAIVPGEPTNLKITESGDLALARALLEQRGRDA